MVWLWLPPIVMFSRVKFSFMFTCGDAAGRGGGVKSVDIDGDVDDDDDGDGDKAEVFFCVNLV